MRLVANVCQSYINARVAATAFARRVQVWSRRIARLKKRSVIGLLSALFFSELSDPFVLTELLDSNKAGRRC
jgi:hypothetical protein